MIRFCSSALWALAITLLLPILAHGQQPTGLGGTVNSVGVTTPSWLTVSPPTVTTRGVFQFGTASQSPRMFLASPLATSGPLTPRTIQPQDLPLGSTGAPGALQCGTNVFCAGGVISLPQGNGNVSGPSSAIVGYAPLWANTGGTALGQGLPIATTGNSTIIQTDSTGAVRAPINTTNGSFGGLTATGSFTATGLVSGADLAAGAALGNIGNLSTAQFIGYGGNGSGPAQPVTIQGGGGTSINCTTTTCTISGGGVSGPGSTITGYVPLWSSTTGVSLSSGLPVGTSGASTIIQADINGHIANSLINNLPNSSLANPQITLGSSNVSLGGSLTNISGLTLASTTIQSATIALGSDATGDTYFRNSSGNLTRIGIGSNGQIWTSNGTQPTWAAAPVSGINTLTQDVTAAGSGSQPATVVGLQGRALLSTAPTMNQMIGWNGSAYAPENSPPATGVTPGSYTVASIGGLYFCETVNASGQITTMNSGQCGTAPLLLNNGGDLLLNSGGNVLLN